VGWCACPISLQLGRAFTGQAFGSDRRQAANHPGSQMSESAATLRSWLLLAGEKESAVGTLETEHTCLLIRQRFDAAKLDELEEEPLWLDGLFERKRWRRLLCSLLEANPGSLLLQSAVRRILQSPHAAEVTCRPGLCALIGTGSSLGDFVGSLGTPLQALLRDDAGAQEALSGIGCAGEVQLLCSQLLLHAAAHAVTTTPPASAPEGDATRAGTKRPRDEGEPGADSPDAAGPAAAAPITSDAAPALVGRLRVAAEHMAAAAAAEQGVAARRLQLLALGVPRHSRLLSSLLAVLAGGTISTGDARNLHEVYCGPAAEAEPPPLAPLQQPALIELMLNAAFHPDRACKPETRDRVLELLAFAAAHAAPDAAPADDDGGALAAVAAARAEPTTPRAPALPGATAALKARREALLEVRAAHATVSRPPRPAHGPLPPSVRRCYGRCTLRASGMRWPICRGRWRCCARTWTSLWWRAPPSSGWRRT
jgi:hypothetical protein